MTEIVDRIHEEQQATRWVQEWKTGSVVDFRIGRDGADLVAEWNGLCEVRIARSGVVRRFVLHEGVDASKARRLLDGPVRALVRHLSGNVSLHASAVAHRDAAVVFLGASTCGKSTLAAELCRLGLELLADDAAFLDERIGRFFVVPSESVHWLRDDAGEALGAEAAQDFKRQLAATSVAAVPVPLRLMVALVFDESVPRACLRRLQGHEAFRWVRTSMYRLVIDEPAVDARDFATLAALYAQAPLFELRRRRRLADLGESVELLLGALDHLRQPQGAP